MPLGHCVIWKYIYHTWMEGVSTKNHAQTCETQPMYHLNKQQLLPQLPEGPTSHKLPAEITSVLFSTGEPITRQNNPSSQTQLRTR